MGGGTSKKASRQEAEAAVGAGVPAEGKEPEGADLGAGKPTAAAKEIENAASGNNAGNSKERHEEEKKEEEEKSTDDSGTSSNGALSLGGSKNGSFKSIGALKDSETKRFREKKKGFTGFRAFDLNAESGGSEMAACGLQIGSEGEKSSQDVETARKQLEGFPLFEEEVLEDIFTAMSAATCAAGKEIFLAGKPFLYFVLLIEGELSLDGESVTKANEQCLLGPGLCSGTLRAEADSRVWVISRLQYQKVTVQALQRKLERGGSLLENITEIPGLKELPRETREAIAVALKPVSFKRGEYLMKQGEQGHTMYFIEDGEVVIKQNGGRHTKVGDTETKESAESGVVARRTRGEYIGEGALLDEDNGTSNFGVRNATAIADSEVVKCLALGRHEFQEYMGSLRELFEHNLCSRVLKSLDLTKDLDDAQLSMIVSMLEEGEYEPGEHVVRQGEIGDIFYIVKDGTLECTLRDPENPDAAEQRVGTLISGDYFGEGALLTNAPRRCNVFAVGTGTTKVWGLKRSNFESLQSEALKEKLGNTFQSRKTAKETSNGESDVAWDDLQKIRTLGSGSYGTVDLVRHKVTGETYALKRIRKATVVAKKQQRFIKNERELMGMTNSPFIVNLICTFNQGDSVYMLTEVCLGGELYSLMKDTVDQRNQEVTDDDDFICGCFELATQCRFYTACIILSIEYLHSKGIIHRDIKPENLLLMENGYLKLADLGFAKMIHDQRTYSLCGTPEYTAPEVYKRTGHSKGVDWWSMGVILYEMASGFSPFHVVSQNSWDCYIEISKYEKFYPNIQFPSIFDDTICDFLLRLMHPNHTKRYGTRKLNASHIKRHPFFARSEAYPFAIDWEAIENRTYAMDEKYRPRPPESGLDAHNFETCDDRHEDDGKYLDQAMIQDAGSWHEAF